MNEPNPGSEPRSRLRHFLSPDDLGELSKAIETLLRLEHENHCLLIIEVPLYFQRYQGNPARSCAEAVEEHIQAVECFIRGLHSASKRNIS